MDTKPKSTRKPATTRGVKPARAVARTSATAVSSDPPEPTHDAIALRAHALWERSGRPGGREQEFWLEAERQLRDEARTIHV